MLSTANSQTLPATARSTRPAVAASSAAVTNRCSPKRCASRGPRKPMPAKAITGSVVITPAIEDEACSPRSRSVSSAPTLVTATRMVRPVSTTAARIRIAVPAVRSRRAALTGAGEFGGIEGRRGHKGPTSLRRAGIPAVMGASDTEARQSARG